MLSFVLKSGIGLLLILPLFLLDLVFALFLKASTWGLLPFCPRSVGEGVKHYEAKIPARKNFGVRGPCIQQPLRVCLLPRLLLTMAKFI